MYIKRPALLMHAPFFSIVYYERKNVSLLLFLLSMEFLPLHLNVSVTKQKINNFNKKPNLYWLKTVCEKIGLNKKRNSLFRIWLAMETILIGRKMFNNSFEFLSRYFLKRWNSKLYIRRVL